MSSPITISDSLVQADWKELAHTLKSIECGVEGNDADSKKLRAKLGVIRVLIYEKMISWNGQKTVDIPFFIGSFKSIQMIQQEFDKKNIKKRELLVFLRLLFYKIKKQKLVAKKPLGTLAEVHKMKELVENGDSPI